MAITKKKSNMADRFLVRGIEADAKEHLEAATQ